MPLRATRSAAAALLATLLLSLASADKPAAATLEAMVATIQAGRAQNNFFSGDDDIVRSRSDGPQVAGCLLDKVSAIVEEGGIASFANDLLVDLAACCTKPAPAGGAACVEVPYRPRTSGIAQALAMPRRGPF